MSILKLFSGPSPEKLEQKGDALFEAKLWGQAKQAYDRAFHKLEKQSVQDTNDKKRIAGKVLQAREALAREHQQNAENLLEGGHFDEARDLLSLALEISADAQFKEELGDQLHGIDLRQSHKPGEDLPDLLYGQEEADDTTGEATLKITPVHGDTVYYESGGSEPTPSSMKVESFNNFKVSELKCKFICIDSTGKHEQGTSEKWNNTITLKHRVFQQGDGWMVELRTSPNADIKYTTNGSDPKAMGAVYNSPFPAPESSPFVLAVAERNGVSSIQEKINVNDYRKKTVKIDPAKKTIWKRKHNNLTTIDAHAFMERLKKYQGKAYGVTIDIQSNNDDQDISYTAADNFGIQGENFEKIVKQLQSVMSGSQIFLNIELIEFEKGQLLWDFIADAKSSLSPGEVSQ